MSDDTTAVPPADEQGFAGFDPAPAPVPASAASPIASSPANTAPLISAT